MNAIALRLGVPAALMLALSACAGTPSRIEDPHHYSRDRDGNRIACYATATANEYECVPVARRHPHSYAYYDPFWDPWWPYGVGYGWYHPRVVYDPYPPYPAHPSSRRPRR